MQTVEALLRTEAQARVVGSAQYRFCKEPSCDTVYFGQGSDDAFCQADLRVPVFQKSSDPERLVCYCFGHSVAEVARDDKESGTSPVLGEIAEKCRRGLDRCEIENPQGSCCLGNVCLVITQAAKLPGAPRPFAASSDDDPAGVPDCCASSPKKRA